MPKARRSSSTRPQASSTKSSSEPEQPDGAAGDQVLIEGALTIAEVSHWHARLSVCMAGDAKIKLLDLTRLTTIDAFGLQLLCAARRSADALEKQLEITGAGPVVISACERAGLKPEQIGIAKAS
jgi:anti-anti-sigma regulatory factor